MLTVNTDAPLGSGLPTESSLPARLLALAAPLWLERIEHGWTLKNLTAGGRYEQVSPVLGRLWGRNASELLGRSDAEIFGAALAAPWRAAEQTAIGQASPLWSEHRLDVDGQRRDFEVLRLSFSEAGQQWMLALWRDASENRRHSDQLRHALEQIEQQQRDNERLRRELADQALRDPSTGLYTRAHFEDQLRREADLSTREQREFSIVFIALGSGPEGSLPQVLEALGQQLRGGTRAMDASCRYDGSRFAVLLSGVGLATAHGRMEGLRRRCAAQIVVDGGHERRYTVAMGVASYPHTAQTLDALVSACDAALAQARERGGNQVVLAAIPFEG
ncbi:MAG: GGDEF domain-containing protein [Rubrivivax sp.]|jgi:GGDEF domain-containing protein